MANSLIDYLKPAKPMQITAENNLKTSAWAPLSLAVLSCIFFSLLTSTLALGEETSEENSTDESLFAMPLKDVMDIEVVSLGSLTMTTRQLNPAAITTITQDQISMSGAHSLNEVLEIYVPNFQFIRHNWEAPHIGLRGIINDRDDKYLLLVNGRNMNEKLHYGALSERDLVMLGDIHHIDVIRGPGSPIYGPGAISMVINIVTYNGLNFEGTEFTTKAGAVEEFYSWELKHGQKIDEDSGIFLYGGVDKYNGADESDSPMRFGTSFETLYDEKFFVQKGKSVPYDINNDGEAYRDKPRLKFHTQYTKGNFDLWARYTRGGYNYSYSQGVVAEPPYDILGINIPSFLPLDSIEDFPQAGEGYQQFTIFTGYKQEVSNTFTVDYVFSYDLFDWERINFNEGNGAQSSREDEYYGKILSRWTPNEQHSIAFGGEYSYEIWGKRSPGFPHEAPYSDTLGGRDNPMEDWKTTTYSLMSEYQWNMNEAWTTFVGGRLDKNTYTDEMFSPRWAMIYTPNDKNTYKLMLARSVRMSFAEELRQEHLASGSDGDTETMDNVELRFERQHTDELWFAAGGYLSKLDIIAFDRNAEKSQDLGEQKHWGLEVEAKYIKGKLDLGLSHGYTKLIDFDLEPGSSTVLTAEPLGFGDDLANWSNHITKLQAVYTIDPKWRVNGSARIYWGYPGAKDLADSNAPYARDPGYDDPYDPSYFINLGLEHKPNKNLTVRVDGSNLMGFIDDKYNKRLYGFDFGSSYRSQAASVIFSLRYTF
jgi:iron complex outermembrane receptor protein